MQVARAVFGVAITFGAVVILLTLLNRRVRLLVQGSPDPGLARLFALETTTRRLPAHEPRTSLVTN